MTSDNQITADNVYQRSRRNSLFDGLNEEQIKTLFSISKEIALEKDCYLIHEGDPAQEIFLIIDGQLEVSRYDAKHQQNHAINTLGVGDTVGEVCLLDNGLRSASVCAKSPCRVLSISFDDLRTFASKDKDIYSIFYHLTKNISQRLRHSSDIALQAMEQKLDEFKTRVTLGNFFVLVVSMLSLFTFSLDGLKYVMNVGKNSSYVTLPLTFAIVISLIIFIKTSGFPLSTFGLTLNNWKKAIFEGIFFTIPTVIFILAMKWTLISYAPDYMGRHLIEGITTLNADPGKWWTFFFIYILIVVPLQEFVSRGGLQGPLEEFISSKYKVILAILVSNLLFSTMHLFMSLEFALLTFIAGVYFGWLYSRTHNLLGVWIAHAIVGAIGVCIIGF